MSQAEKIKQQVEVREESLVLPTYPLTGENPNPVFRSQYGVAHIYPYTLLTEIADERSDREYRALVLENCYLRLTVLPDLGGRVYAVYDKISERDVFYRNTVVKFSPLAIRGAFFSGGLEFSFPVAHAPTTADAINWSLARHEDGSASIHLGAREHINGMRWMITLSLYPERSAFSQDVWLYNPTSVPGRYHYWTNASLDSEPGTEFIYPLRRVRSYEFLGTASWPFARLDLIRANRGLPGMEGVPMWPADRMQGPFNFRFEENMLAQVSIFGRDVEWGFFGAWQHDRGHGYAHIADHRDVSGMKLWSWGTSDVGRVNQTALMDDGSYYAETQCGAMETQLDFDLLPPGAVRSWREWWLPLRGIGGLTASSEEVGANVELQRTEEGDNLNVRIALCPATPQDGVRVQLAVARETIIDEKVSMAPEQPATVTGQVSPLVLGDKPLHLTVRGADDHVLLDYTLDREACEVPPDEPLVEAAPETGDDFYALGLGHENFDNRREARETYRRALALDPQHGRAHLRLGLMLLRAADWAQAGKHFKAAVDAGLEDAHYYQGIRYLYTGEPESAQRALEAVPAGSELRGPALVARSQAALHQSRLDEAAEAFGAAQEHETGRRTALLLEAILARSQGDNARAEAILQGILEEDPLNHVALRELAAAGGKDTVAQRLERMLRDDRHYWLDLADFYLVSGLFEEALAILEEAYESWAYPPLAYLAWDAARRFGNDEVAEGWLERAQMAPMDYVFPSRLSEIHALQKALAAAPDDARARYYLGNFMYAYQRPDEAMRLWEAALPTLAHNDVIRRNLGLAYLEQEGDVVRAQAMWEDALALNPANQDLYLLLDDLYKQAGMDEKRAELLVQMQALSTPREDVRKRIPLILVDLERADEALAILEMETFVPLEMDQSFHDLYVRALLQRAARALEKGETEQVIASYRQALRYPDNLGVGRPTTMAQAEILYRLGRAYEQQGKYGEALEAWLQAAGEHHEYGTPRFVFVQKALDKLGRYSEIGLYPPGVNQRTQSLQTQNGGAS
jgi:tetratricopeptide (TPR) repeat protein